MATIKIAERVVIKAPVDRVWKFLLDPPRVVECLPGAHFDGAESETIFLGHMKVKVGPVTTLFAGKATMAEVDEEARRVRIIGEGKDKSGAGTARLQMIGRVSEVDGGSELAVDADVDLTGKIVTFGRGLITSVSAQLFKEFAARARATLELPEVAAAPAGDPAAPAAGPPAVRQAEALHALPLLLRSIRASIARFFRRLFRR